MKKNMIIAVAVIAIFYSAGAQVKQIAEKNWSLETSNMFYKLKVSNNRLVNGYYGPSFSYSAENTSYFNGNDEVPVRGSWANKTPILEAVFKDGTRDLDLRYESSAISKKDGYTILQVDQKDAYYPLKVSSFFRVIPEFDMIEKWLEISIPAMRLLKLKLQCQAPYGCRRELMN